MEISSSALIFLKREDKVNRVVPDILKSTITIQNSQCIQCSPVFFYGRKIENDNPLFERVLGIEVEKGCDTIFMKECICGVAN